MDLKYISGEDSYSVNVDEKEGFYFVTLDGKTFKFDVSKISDNVLSLLDANGSTTAYCVSEGTEAFVSVNGSVYKFEDAFALEDELASTASATDSGEASGNIKSTMPGKIWKMQVSEGDTVEVGQTVVILESMKMEHSIKTGVSGTVIKVYVEEGEQVDLAQPLVDIEMNDKEEDQFST